MLACALASLPAWAGDLNSPFQSTVDGITIRNTHLVAGSLASGKAAVLRGQEPRNQIQQLLDKGVTDVVIFKNELGTEVRDEIQALRDAKLEDVDHRVHSIPFRWKKLTDADFHESCSQLLEGLTVLRDVLKTPKRRVYFHCTVGEDRTGLLAGLFRSLNQGWDMTRTFHDEMCENGYEAGNPNKPVGTVVPEVRRSLTPVFTKMEFLIQKGALTLDNVDDDSICDRDPKFDPEWRKEYATAKFDPKKYRCWHSSQPAAAQ
jgi:hypothetical protein